MDEVRVQQFYNDIIGAIDATTDGKGEAHFALKFTALISTDIMTRLSRAQNVFMDEILKYNKQEQIDISDLRNSLLERGISFSKEELEGLFESLKFPNNQSDKVSNLEVYANAHLFKLDKAQRSKH